MTTYIVRRLLQSLVVVIIITLLVFFAMRLLPGDPILMYITGDQYAKITEEQIEALRVEFGLDRPMIVQYVDWMSGVVRGDLGTSIFYRVPVSAEVARRIPITFHLGSIALMLSVIVGIPLGVIAAVRRGRWLDAAVTSLANIGITVPVFWLGLLLIYLFGLKLRLLPVYGYTSPFEDFWLNTRQVIMPVVCLAIFPLASAARQTRSSMLEVIRQDYIRTAWAKGLTERAVIIRHALKNGLIPVITLIGITVRQIFGGSVLIETVFNIPGMGRLAADALFAQDYALVQGTVLIMGLIVTFANLIVDLSYGWLDPKVRFD